MTHVSNSSLLFLIHRNMADLLIVTQVLQCVLCVMEYVTSVRSKVKWAQRQLNGGVRLDKNVWHVFINCTTLHDFPSFLSSTFWCYHEVLHRVFHPPCDHWSSFCIVFVGTDDGWSSFVARRSLLPYYLSPGITASFHKYFQYKQRQ